MFLISRDVEQKAKKMSSMNEKLKRYAELVETELEQFYDEKTGFLFSALNLDTRKPMTSEDLSGDAAFPIADYYAPNTYDGVMRYENTGMVQGTLLAAMCLKYRATGDPEALKKAERTFKGIVKVYEMSQVIAPGFYCKPWGGAVTDETSSDQYIYSMTGLDAYYPIASDQEKEMIRRMIPAMVEFWLSHNYEWKFLGENMQWQQTRFIGFMALAYKYSGDPKYEKEMERLIQLQKNSPQAPYNALEQNRSRQKNGQTLFSPRPEACLSSLLSMLPAMKVNPDPVFADLNKRIYHQGRQGLAPDGTVYNMLVKNADEETYHEIPLSEAAYTPVPANYFQLYGVWGPYRQGGMQTLMYSRFLLLVKDYISLPEDPVALVEELLLKTWEHDHLTWYEDPNGIFPPCIHWMQNFCSGDAVTHWLWCYWKLYSMKNGKEEI